MPAAAGFAFGFSIAGAFVALRTYDAIASPGKTTGVRTTISAMNARNSGHARSNATDALPGLTLA